MITREWPMILISDVKFNDDRRPIENRQKTVVGLSLFTDISIYTPFKVLVSRVHLKEQYLINRLSEKYILRQQ
jgi:hypothetical protein